jgi:hypothetical protein
MNRRDWREAIANEPREMKLKRAAIAVYAATIAHELGQPDLQEVVSDAMLGRNGREVVRLAEAFVERTRGVSTEEIARMFVEKGCHSADDFVKGVLSELAASDWSPEALRALETSWQKIQPLPKDSGPR